MADIKFTNNSVQVKNAMRDACVAWLEGATGEVESRAKRNSPVDTEQLKNSWSHVVDESSLEGIIGSMLENAIWNEFGTGEYATNGNGRKTPWVYQDRYGKFHKTTGKKAQHTLQNSIDSVKNLLQKSLESKLKGLGK